MTMNKDAAAALYREQLESLAEIRDRVAATDPASAEPEQLLRMWLVLEIVNALETDAAVKLEECLDRAGE